MGKWRVHKHLIYIVAEDQDNGSPVQSDFAFQPKNERYCFEPSSNTFTLIYDEDMEYCGTPKRAYKKALAKAKELNQRNKK